MTCKQFHTFLDRPELVNGPTVSEWTAEIDRLCAADLDPEPVGLDEAVDRLHAAALADPEAKAVLRGGRE